MSFHFHERLRCGQIKQANVSVVRSCHHLVDVSHELTNVHWTKMVIEFTQWHLFHFSSIGCVCCVIVVACSHLIVEQWVNFGVVALEADAQKFSIVTKAGTIGIF